MKVADLTGALLAEWVARANGWKVERDGDHPAAELICWDDHGAPHSFGEYGYRPDKNWAEGGPVIEREKIDLMHVEYSGPAMGGSPGEPWNAMMKNLSIDNPDWDSMSGPTPLIAAMRAYIGSRFGSDVPDEVVP